MVDWIAALRRLASPDDRRQAAREEDGRLARVADHPAVDPRFAAEMRALAARPAASVLVGAAAEAPSIPVRIERPDLLGTGHGLVLGATGSGKTRVVTGIIRELLRAFARAPDGMGLVIVDHKSELTDLARTVLAGIVMDLPHAARAALLDRVVVLNPFSRTALVPLQILRPEPGVDPEVQTYEVTTLVDRLGGDALGVRQDTFLSHLILLGITTGRTLPDLARLLSNPVELAAAAATAPSADVRAFFSGGPRAAPGSIEGVRARLHRLLRLPSTRLMLGSRDCLSFRSLLRGKIVLIDVGSPPLGCEDLGRFWAGLVTLKLTRAIFERTHDEARTPTLVVVDEWQEGLAGGGDIAENYERVLAQARSRGVSYLLVSQSLAGAARVSSSLPKVVATNTSLQLLFRSSPEDARAMGHLLPVTGRRFRETEAPWEERPRSPYFTVAEERDLVISEVSALPDRVFYLWNRRRPYRAERVRAVDVDVRRPALLPAGVGARLRDGAVAVPIRELAPEPTATPTAAAPEAPAPPIAEPPRRRRRRRREE